MADDAQGAPQVDKDELIGALVAKLEELRAQNNELRQRLTDSVSDAADTITDATKQKLEYYQYEVSRLNEQVSQNEWMVQALKDYRSGVTDQIDDRIKAFDEAAESGQSSYLTAFVGGLCAVVGVFCLGFGALGHQLLPAGIENAAARFALISYVLMFGTALLIFALLSGLRSLLQRFSRPVDAAEGAEHSPLVKKLSQGGSLVILASLLMFSLAIVLSLFPANAKGLGFILKMDLIGFGSHLATSAHCQWIMLSLFCATVFLVAACGGATVRAHLIYFESLKAYMRNLRQFGQ
jgi:hypothetical protein